MAQLKTKLNLDPNFQDWASATAINTSNWTFAGTNATQLQLDRQHDRAHIERTRFPSAMKSSDYIYNGRFSWRGIIDTASGTFALTSNELAFDAGMIPAVTLVYRASAGLDLTARIVIAPSIGGTDMGSLNFPAVTNNQNRKRPFWDTTATVDNALITNGNAVDFWETYGIQGPKAPGGARSIQVRIDVTDNAASIPAYFDIGELSVEGVGTLVHGVG